MENPRRIVACALAVSLTLPLVPAQNLPEGLVLPEGVEIPEGFELPADLKIPDGFEITQEMVEQYIKYMESQQNKDSNTSTSSERSGDAWFKQLGKDHPNSYLQMNAKDVDQTSVNEDSSYSAKSYTTMTSKAVIPVVIGVVVIAVFVWALLTKCGKKGCCKRQKASQAAQASARKSVKSDRSDNVTKNDIESNSNFTEMGADLASQSKNDPKSDQGIKFEAEMADATSQGIDVSQKPFSLAAKSENIGSSRASSAGPKTVKTADRLSLPTVSVPLEAIKDRRSLASEQGSQRPKSASENV